MEDWYSHLEYLQSLCKTKVFLSSQVFCMYLRKFISVFISHDDHVILSEAMFYNYVITTIKTVIWNNLCFVSYKWNSNFAI